jgi:hypothetical protein
MAAKTGLRFNPLTGNFDNITIGLDATDIVGLVTTNNFVKQMVAGAAFSLGQPVSKRNDGKIVRGGSDGATSQNFVGFSLQSSTADGDLINVLLASQNLVGVLTGLGFNTGDEIYLNESGGYTNTVAGFTGNNDSVVKLGIADCGAGVASTTATDLIIFVEVIYRP